MQRALLWIASICVLQGVSTIAYAGQPAKAPSTVTPQNDFVVGDPIRHENLTIFPVTSRASRDVDRFITLDEGIKAGTIEVLEVSAVTDAEDNADTANPFAQPALPQRSTPQASRRTRSRTSRNRNAQTQSVQTPNQANGNERPVVVPQATGNSVNQLYVINKSSKPLYLMPGEVIIGGDQDRTIGREYVIQPTKKPELIEVYCVEHGRWGSRDQQAYASLVVEATAHHDRRASVALSRNGGNAAELTKQANEGRFVGSVGKLSKGARIAVQEGKGQSEVWDEVGKENAKSRVTSQSGAFTGNYSEKAAVKRLDPYIAKIQSPISETDRVVGVLVAVNDKMDSAEVLESTPLFKKLWPKLLKSYALDAANASEAEQPKAKEPCTRADAIAFLTKLQNANADSKEVNGKVAITRHVTDHLSTFNAFDQVESPQGAGGGFGGFGGGIHSSGFSK